MAKIRKVITLVSSDLFLVALFLYLAAVRIDLSLDGLISRAFNPSVLLFICLLSGVGTILCDDSHEESARAPMQKRVWFYGAIFSMLVGSIVYEVLKELSSWALLLGPLAAFIVFLTSFVIIQSSIHDD